MSKYPWRSIFYLKSQWIWCFSWLIWWKNKNSQEVFPESLFCLVYPSMHLTVVAAAAAPHFDIVRQIVESSTDEIFESRVALTTFVNVGLALELEEFPRRWISSCLLVTFRGKKLLSDSTRKITSFPCVTCLGLWTVGECRKSTPISKPIRLSFLNAVLDVKPGILTFFNLSDIKGRFYVAHHFHQNREIALFRIENHL